MSCLILFSMVFIFNQAGDFEAFVCHADEPRREPKYMYESSICFGLRKTINNDYEENSTSPTNEGANVFAKNILKPELRIRSPFVIDKNDSFSEEELQKQLAIQAALKNPRGSIKKVQ